MHDVGRPQAEATASDAISCAIRRISAILPVAALVNYTESGASSLRASRERPTATILSLTPSLHTARRLTVAWGIYSVVNQRLSKVEEVSSTALEIAQARGFGFTALLARKDLVDGGEYQSTAGLRGRKIGVPDLASGGTIEIEQMLRRGGLTLADVELISMPFPDQIPAPVALYAALLFQKIGETARFDEMVEFLFLNVLPILRSKDAVLLEPDARFLLLECYRATLTQLDRRPRLAQYWVPAQIACQSILDADGLEVRHLLALAEHQQFHLRQVDGAL